MKRAREVTKFDNSDVCSSSLQLSVKPGVHFIYVYLFCYISRGTNPGQISFVPPSKRQGHK